MIRKGLAAVGTAYVLSAFAGAGVQTHAQDEGLILRAPRNVFVVPKAFTNRERFINWIFWTDIPPDSGTFIHQPDTLGWNVNPSKPSSTVSTAGAYLGTVDRTVRFRVPLIDGRSGGDVPQAETIILTYSVIGEGALTGSLDAGSDYQPGDTITALFQRNSATGQPDTLDFGLRVMFSAGHIDSGATFLVGMEDFEGFHTWRAIEPDGRDLEILGEVSKEENFATAGFDSLYFTEIIPALRTDGFYRLPFEIPGIGSVIDLRGIHPNDRLDPEEFFWFDRNAFNGFTYYYAVTTFDRGYSVLSGQQGLTKFDRCQPTQGLPFPCPDELVEVSSTVSAQNDLAEIYVVPNPYRSGSSQFTTENYHNYPDNKLRFVNVPQSCMLKVYTPAGDVVWQTDNNDGAGVIAWDTRNEAGEFVSSGIYMYRVQVADGSGMYGRIVIIR